MAEELHDPEFWLPSHFLTDDDILMDFDLDFSASSTTTHGGSSASISDLDFTSADSDEDDVLRLTRQLDSLCPVHSKGCGVLSSSPQSTLYGCVCNQSSSRESLSPPPQPLSEDNDKKDSTAGVTEATLDLLNKAAGEVARLKMKTEKKVGTGFFDCTQKRVSYPPPLNNHPLYFQPQFLHFPPMLWPPSNMVQYNQPKQPQPQQPPQRQPQNRATKSHNQSNTNTTTNTNTNTNSKNINSNRPLGLPPSAWPPLQAQPPTQAKAQPQPVPPVFVGPPKGTGVFLPRRVATPVNEPRKKDGITTKSKSGKGSQSQANHRRNSGKTSTPTMTTDHNDIQLPQEWTY